MNTLSTFMPENIFNKIYYFAAFNIYMCLLHLCSRFVISTCHFSAYCSSGREKTQDGNCQMCELGYFKDNAIDLFSNCTRCLDDRYVTPTQGSTSNRNCTVCKLSFNF